MVCKKCGKKLRENEKFCTVCGYYNDDSNNLNMTEEVVFGNMNNDNFNLLDEDNDINTTETTGFSLSNSTRSISGGDFEFKDNRYIEAYIGEYYKWVMRRPFNIFAFLLSWAYFLYRKLYLVGIIGLAITGVVVRLFTNLYVIIPYSIVVMIFSGFAFNPIYRNVVKKRVEKIKTENDGTDEFNLEKICAEKGGVTFKWALLIYAIFLIIMFFTYFTISINKDHNPKFWKENSENKANCISLTKQIIKTFEQNSITGEPKEAVCSVNTEPKKYYDIYYKFVENGKTRYVYFKQESNYVVFVEKTDGIAELEIKKANNTITDEEKQTLENKKQVENDYIKILQKSKEEDLLIKNKKNTSQKLHYIVSKDEIER